MFILFPFLNLRNSGGVLDGLLQQGSPTTKKCLWVVHLPFSSEGEGLQYSPDCHPELKIYVTKCPTIKTHTQFKISQHNSRVLCDIFYPMQVISHYFDFRTYQRMRQDLQFGKHPSRLTCSCAWGNRGPKKGSECPNCCGFSGYIYLQHLKLLFLQLLGRNRSE